MKRHTHIPTSAIRIESLEALKSVWQYPHVGMLLKQQDKIWMLLDVQPQKNAVSIVAERFPNERHTQLLFNMEEAEIYSYPLRNENVGPIKHGEIRCMSNQAMIEQQIGDDWHWVETVLLTVARQFMINVTIDNPTSTYRTVDYRDAVIAEILRSHQQITWAWMHQSWRLLYHYCKDGRLYTITELRITGDRSPQFYAVGDNLNGELVIRTFLNDVGAATFGFFVGVRS